MLKIAGNNGISEIYIENNLFENAAEMCLKKFKMKKLHIITDENVEQLYLEELISTFSELVYEEDSQYFDEDFEMSYSVVPTGEQSKNISIVSDIYDSLAELNFSREDLIIGLGGGVVGDIAGFTAATYLRGVKICQIPTSLLAQVDSSVGGKCGINIEAGKNLVGTFYHPHLVMVDPILLNTLPDKDFSDGAAEIIKYGVIKDKTLLDKLKKYKTVLEEETRSKLLLDIIFTCISIKKSFVEKDEKDRGLRQILNFGHTIGHAIEVFGNYQEYTHGQAVAIGMAVSVKAFPSENENVYKELIEILDLYKLPTENPYDMNLIFEAVKNDKKTTGEMINFIVLRDFEETEILRINLNELLKILNTI